MTVSLHLGDCLDVMPTLEANSVDSIVCDPPYGLSFMGKNWDHGVPGVAFWQAALRVAKPGAHLLAFGGDRTHHRMMTAIEDAGWEIRTCLYWIFGSGFPKSLAIDKAIDKAAPRIGMFDAFGRHYKERRLATGLTHSQVCGAGGFFAEHNHGGASVNWESGYNVPTREQWKVLQPLLGLSLEWLPLIERIEAEREVVGQQKQGRLAVAPGQGRDRGAVTLDITAPATDAAKQWQGWGTALKPAAEIIVMARKPLQGTVAENVLTWGVGGINVDACRVGTDEITINRHGGYNSFSLVESTAGKWQGNQAQQQGRWPANLLLDEAAADALDEMSGTLTSGANKAGSLQGRGVAGIYGDYKGFAGQEYQSNSGGASRFFFRVTSEPLCALCSCPKSESHGIMNEKGDIIPCAKSANNAETNSSPRITTTGNGSVATNVLDSGRHENGVTAEQSSALASNVEKSIKDLQASESTFVPTSAEESRSAQIAQSVKSAGNLCDLCAISIAQSIVAMQQSQDPALILGRAFIPERKRQILTQCLASFVALLGNTDTIPTMDSLNLLFGSVYHAIESYTANQNEIAASQTCQPSRLRYHSKASKRDRDEGLEGMEERRSGTGALRAEQGGEYLDFVYPMPDGLGAWLRAERERVGMSVKDVARHFPSRTGGLTGCVSNWECEYNRPTPDQWRTLRAVIGFDGRYDEAMTSVRSLLHAEREGPIAVKRNHHPTVKPTQLMRYLVRLVTPPNGTILDPFCGSGSTGKAAVLEGFNFVGIELDSEYIEIARRRIEYAQQAAVQPVTMQPALLEVAG